MKKVFGALSVSQSSTAGVKPLSHGLRPKQLLPVVNLSVTGFAVTAPLVGEPLAKDSFFDFFAYQLQNQLLPQGQTLRQQHQK